MSDELSPAVATAKRHYILERSVLRLHFSRSVSGSDSRLIFLSLIKAGQRALSRGRVGI